MANIKSNAKRAITNKLAEARNKSHKSKLKTIIKKLEVSVKAKDGNSTTLLSEANKSIDSGAIKNIWHKNSAARKKSTLAKLVNKK